jgi:hypothetical protein
VVLPSAAEERLATSGAPAHLRAGDIDIDPATGKVTRVVYPGHYMFYANGATSEQLGFTRDAGRTDPTLPAVFAGGAGGDHGLAYIIAMPGTGHASHDAAQ